jgi:hypothetical protein
VESRFSTQQPNTMRRLGGLRFTRRLSKTARLTQALSAQTEELKLFVQSVVHISVIISLMMITFA